MGRAETALKALGGAFSGAYDAMDDISQRKRQDAQLELQERRAKAAEDLALKKLEGGSTLQQNVTRLFGEFTPENVAKYYRLAQQSGGGGGDGAYKGYPMNPNKAATVLVDYDAAVATAKEQGLPPPPKTEEIVNAERTMAAKSRQTPKFGLYSQFGAVPQDDTAVGEK